MRLLLLTGCALLLANCNVASKPDFYQMSEEELFAYNLEKPLPQKVYCYKRKEASSWIPKRRCQTLQEMADESARNADRIETLSPASSYSVLRSND